MSYIKSITFKLYEKDCKFADEPSILQKIRESSKISNIDQQNIESFFNILSGKSTLILPRNFYDFFRLATTFQIQPLLNEIIHNCKSINNADDILYVIYQNRKITSEEEPLFNEFIEVGGMRKILSEDIDTCLNHYAFASDFPASSIFNILNGSKYSTLSSCADKIYKFIKESYKNRLHFLPFVDAFKLSHDKLDSLFKLLLKVEGKLKLHDEQKEENEQNSNLVELITSKLNGMQNEIETLRKEKEELQEKIHEISIQKQSGTSGRQLQQNFDEEDKDSGKEEVAQRFRIAPSNKIVETPQTKVVKYKNENENEKRRSQKGKDKLKNDISKTYNGPPPKILNSGEENHHKIVSGGKTVYNLKHQEEESSDEADSSNKKKGKSIKKETKNQPISSTTSKPIKKQQSKLPSANDQHDVYGDDDYDDFDDATDYGDYDDYYNYYDHDDDNCSQGRKKQDSDRSDKKRREDVKIDIEKKKHDSHNYHRKQRDQDDYHHAKPHQNDGPKHITAKNRRRIETFKENEKIAKNGKYKIASFEIDIKKDLKFSIDNTKLIANRDKLEFKRKTKTELTRIYLYDLYNKIKVIEESTFAAAIKEKHLSKKVCVLNFASATQPGGGVLNGRNAQEEALSRQSTLYFSLVKQSKFYEYNKAHPNQFGTDYMIYSPNVLIIRDDNDILINPCKVSVISSVAVNNSEVQKVYGRVAKSQEVYDTMKRRCRRLLELCLSEGNDIIILGAFGCGVFKNSPKKISKIFKELLIDEKYACYFKKIVFAIKRKPNESRELIDSFRLAFTYSNKSLYTP